MNITKSLPFRKKRKRSFWVNRVAGGLVGSTRAYKQTAERGVQSEVAGRTARAEIPKQAGKAQQSVAGGGY